MRRNKDVYVNRILFFIRKKIVLLIPENSYIFKYLSILGMRINALKKHKKRDVMKLDIPVVEHCNLCCKGCTAFSPLAEEEFLDYEQYCKDMRRMAELADRSFTQITYTGGEPLLHPQFGRMLKFAYEMCPTAEIDFMTNGVLIPQQKDEFWKTCSDCGVKVRVSKYPINLDHKRITEIEKKWGVNFEWGGGKDIPVKKMWKYPISLSGDVSLRNSFKLCSQINSCIRMKNGKIYPCNTTACIEHFNKYFNKNLELIPGKDYLELEKVKDIQEIFEFLITPPPFCRYCNRAGVTFGYDWAVSRKDMSEWV